MWIRAGGSGAGRVRMVSAGVNATFMPLALLCGWLQEAHGGTWTTGVNERSRAPDIVLLSASSLHLKHFVRRCIDICVWHGGTFLPLLS